MVALSRSRRRAIGVTVAVAFVALGALAAAAVRQRALPRCCPGAGPAALDHAIARDRDLTSDTLANGLHYYIYQNSSTVHRAEVRLVVNAGSVLEEDDQRGLAHAVEHMAIHDTRNFPRNAIQTYIESMGMRRGDGVNATTSPDETVYKLVVPIDRPGAVDTALAMLADIAHNATFEDVGGRSEASVILEEWRSERDAFQRITDARHALIFAGSPYANRAVIGDTSVLRRFDVTAMRRFYDAWYRPELMAVVAVGDFAEIDIAPMITKHFGGLPRSATPPRRPPTVAPPASQALRASIITDPELTDSWVSFWYLHQPRRYRLRSDYRDALIAAMWRGILRSRLDDASATAESPIVSTGIDTRPLSRVLAADVVTAVAMKDRTVATVETVASEIERLARHGAKRDEVNEYARAMLRTARQMTESGDAGADIAAEITDHFLTGNAIVASRTAYELIRDLLPTITDRDVTAYARRMSIDSGVVLIAATTTIDPVATSSANDLVTQMRAAVARPLSPPPDEPNVTTLLDREPAPGRVVNQRLISGARAYEWTLSNGMRVLLKPTHFTFDAIVVRLAAPGGASLASDADYPSAYFSDGIINASGLAAISSTRLSRWLQSTSITISPYVTNDAVSVAGSTSGEEITAFFQLLHLYLTSPRADTVAFRRYRDRMQSLLRDRPRNPDAVFEDTLAAVLVSGHPRAVKSTARFLEAGNLTTALDFWKLRMSNGAGVIAVITGDFTLDRIKPLVERYLASIPAGTPEQPRGVGIPLVRGVVRRNVDSGVSGSARAAIALTGPFTTSTYRTIEDLAAVRDLLQLTVTERLRDQLGGTYGVSVNLETSLTPPARYTFTLDFSAAPERIESLTAAALREIERLQQNGPTNAEFRQTRVARIRDYDGEMVDNDFWLSELSAHARFGWPLEAIADHPNEVERLTLDDLRAACATYIPRGEYVLVVMRPRGRTRARTH